MPKISPSKLKERKPLPNNRLRYTIVPFPESVHEVFRSVLDLRNGQTCTCDHDRMCHREFLGKGEEQVVIIDCPNAGRCGVKGCKCPAFTFGKHSSVEGKKKREQEKKISKAYPPEEK